MQFARYFDPELVFFMNPQTKEEALHQLVEQVSQHKHIPDSEYFYNTLLEREKIVSTGIGMSVAIPHAKLSCYHEFFIAIGILEKGIDWNAIDGAAVRLIFLIWGPDDKQTEYLKILSSLTTAIRQEKLRKEIVTSTSPDTIIHLFDTIV